MWAASPSVGGSAFAVPGLLEVVASVALGWGGLVDGVGWLGGVLVLLKTAAAVFAARKAASTSSSLGAGGWISEAGRLTSGLALTKAAVTSRVFVGPGLVEAPASPGPGVLARETGWLPAGPGLTADAVFASFAREGLVRAAGWAVAVGLALVGTGAWLPSRWVGLVGGVGCVTAGPGLVGAAVFASFVCVGLVRAAG
jgi:hypothetical protein